MITKTIELRQFEECSKELQEKILEKHYDINLDFSLTDYNDTYTLMIEEQGFLNPEISYDLSYCQGSGACFDCTEFDFDKLLKNYKIKHKSWILSILKNYCQGRITRNYYATYYEHENTRDFQLELYDNFTHPRIEKTMQDVRTYIEHLRYDTAHKVYKALQEEYDYLSSPEAIKETLIANDYYFNEQGEIDYAE